MTGMRATPSGSLFEESSGPPALPTCDYCGDDFLIPSRGYKHGCPKHDPWQRRIRERELLASDYSVVRASRAENVEIALIALDRLHDLAEKEIG